MNKSNNVNLFYQKYEEFITLLRTPNKQKNSNLKALTLVKDLLELFKLIVNNDELAQIDNNTIYNLLTLTHAYSKSLNLRTKYGPRKETLLAIKEELNELKKQGIIKENYKSRN